MRDLPLLIFLGVVAGALSAFLCAGFFIDIGRKRDLHRTPESVASVATVGFVFWMIVLPVLLVCALWIGFGALGRGFADLWALRPRRVTVPKATATERSKP